MRLEERVYISEPILCVSEDHHTALCAHDVVNLKKNANEITFRAGRSITVVSRGVGLRLKT